MGNVARMALVKGAVKPWHVLFLYSVSFAVSTVASFYLTRNEVPDIRYEMRDVVWRGINGVIIMFITIVVPEFRRSLSMLFAPPSERIEGRDVALAVAVSLAWGYGLYRIALCFPLVHVDPEKYYGMFLMGRLAEFKPKHLLMLIGKTIAAPLTEDLVVSGYLVNLGTSRWGLAAGILLSSLIFALFHFYTAPFAFPLGVAFAMIYLRYDSLWPGIALHSLYNALAFPWLLGGVLYQKGQ